MRPINGSFWMPRVPDLSFPDIPDFSDLRGQTLDTKESGNQEFPDFPDFPDLRG